MVDVGVILGHIGIMEKKIKLLYCKVGAVFQHYVKFPGFENVPSGLAAVEVAPGTYGFAALFAVAGLHSFFYIRLFLPL